MGQPVEISDELIDDARLMANASQRSIEGQIEFWAELGRSMEPLLGGERALALRQAGTVRSLADAIATVDTAAGRARVFEHLATRPFPHFEPVPNSPGLLRRIDEDGTETIGRFVDRIFEPAES